MVISDFESAKSTLFYMYFNFPTTKTLDNFIYDILKKGNGQPKKLTSRDVHDTVGYNELTEFEELPKSLEGFDVFENKFKSKFGELYDIGSIYPDTIDFDKNGKLHLDSQTADILNKHYFEYRVKKYKDEFKQYVADFENKFLPENVLQILKTYHELLKTIQGEIPKPKVERKIDVRGIINKSKFSDIIITSKSEIDSFLEFKYKYLNGYSMIAQIEIDGVKLFPGLNYDNFFNMQNYLKTEKNYSALCYLFNRMIQEEMIYPKKFQDFVEWVFNNSLISNYLKEDAIAKGKLTLKKSAPVRNEPLFNRCFH